MAEILVDSNVILDVVTEDPKWCAWSVEQLEQLAEHHTLLINPIIYSEVSIKAGKSATVYLSKL